MIFFKHFDAQNRKKSFKTCKHANGVYSTVGKIDLISTETVTHYQYIGRREICWTFPGDLRLRSIFSAMPDLNECNFFSVLLHTLWFAKIIETFLLQLVRDMMLCKFSFTSLIAWSLVRHRNTRRLIRGSNYMYVQRSEISQNILNCASLEVAGTQKYSINHYKGWCT